MLINHGADTMTNQLLKAIGPAFLASYFEFLDDALAADKFRGTIGGAERVLRANWSAMGSMEARTIAKAWDRTFSASKPAEDRACDVLDACEA